MNEITNYLQKNNLTKSGGSTQIESAYCDKQISEFSVDELKLLGKSIQQRLQVAFGNVNPESIALLLELASEEDYTLQRIKDATKYIIKNNKYGKWQIADYFNYNLKLITESKKFQLVDKGASEYDFIPCKKPNSNRLWFWDVNNGELPNWLIDCTPKKQTWMDNRGSFDATKNKLGSATASYWCKKILDSIDKDITTVDNISKIGKKDGK